MARYAPVIEAFQYAGDDVALDAWLQAQGVDPADAPTVAVGDYLIGSGSPDGAPAVGAMPKAMFEACYSLV